MSDTSSRRPAVELPERNAPIYLDYQATTPTDPRVVDAMAPYFMVKYGNPASTSHFYGWEAEEAVEKSREQIASLIGAEPREIIFTSGATEANNLAIQGIAGFYGERKNHIVTTRTEHKCVLETCKYLEGQGFDVTYLEVDKGGLIDLEKLKDAITENTVMVSIMAVNNEIGIIQPIAGIGAICRERKVFFHTDAAQAIGKIPIDVNEINIDLMSISGHKVYGPMGIGVLYMRRRPRVRLKPLFQGGGQERGMRSGTLSTPLCVGMGEACAISEEELAEEATRLSRLRDMLYQGIVGRVPDVHLNGDAQKRIPGNLNFSFDHVDGNGLIAGLTGISVSSGSACTSGDVAPSYVLKALGVEDALAFACVRIGLGRFTTSADVKFAVETIVEKVAKLRAAHPENKVSA
jgi:cysteine desulfurase